MIGRRLKGLAFSSTFSYPKFMRWSFEKKCLVCGNIFRAWGHEQQKFCSRVCFAASRRASLSIDYLRQLYVEQGLSTVDIGKLMGCTSETIAKCLRPLGVLRKPGETFRIKNAAGKIKFNPLRREQSSNWKGGRIRTEGQGYVRILMPQHPRANSSGYVLEHIVEWEKVHTIPVPIGYVIHHLNGIRNDNRPENLVALPTKKHACVLKAKARRIQQLEKQVKVLSGTLST